MASSDEKERVWFVIVGDEEATSAFCPGGSLSTDRETKSCRERALDAGCVAMMNGEELGAGELENDRLSNLDVDVGDVVLFKKSFAFGNDGLTIRRG